MAMAGVESKSSMPAVRRPLRKQILEGDFFFPLQSATMENRRNGTCVAWVNAKSYQCIPIQPFLFAAGNLRDMTQGCLRFRIFAIRRADRFGSRVSSSRSSNPAGSATPRPKAEYEPFRPPRRTLRKAPRNLRRTAAFCAPQPELGADLGARRSSIRRWRCSSKTYRRLERPACFYPATLSSHLFRSRRRRQCRLRRDERRRKRRSSRQRPRHASPSGKSPTAFLTTFADGALPTTAGLPESTL